MGRGASLADHLDEVISISALRALNSTRVLTSFNAAREIKATKMFKGPPRGDAQPFVTLSVETRDRQDILKPELTTLARISRDLYHGGWGES